MIPHAYVDAGDNLAQYMADLIDRQEVTVDWYLDHMIDAAVFRWTSDEDAQLGLDPWRFHADLPIEPEDVKARGWRLFVQRRDMPAHLRTVPPPPGHSAEPQHWAEWVRVYGPKKRSEIGLPAQTDLALANSVFMLSTVDLGGIVTQTAAKDRIRWLSVQLAVTLRALNNLTTTVEGTGLFSLKSYDELAEAVRLLKHHDVRS